MRILWTDGSASPNPGPGGYAVIDQATRRPVALGREKQTTNIRMEGLALMAAIQLAGDAPCEIHTDSEFWVHVLTQWAAGWEKRDWQKRDGSPVQNLDIVQPLYQLYLQHRVRLIWERGHAGTALNELADRWANRAREGATLAEV